MASVRAGRRRGVAPRVQEPTERVRGGSAKEEVAVRGPERGRTPRILERGKLTAAASMEKLTAQRSSRAWAARRGEKSAAAGLEKAFVEGN